MSVDYSLIEFKRILYKSMGELDVWLLLYILSPGLYYKTYIQSVYNAIRRKLGWLNLQEHPFSGFLFFQIIYCINPPIHSPENLNLHVFFFLFPFFHTHI